MARHGENIFKRKDGRWEARYASGKNQNNQTVYRSVYGRTYKEAKEKRSRVLADQSQMQETPGRQYDLSDILSRWLQCNRVHLKEQTYQKYLSCIDRHIVPILGQTALSQLNATTLNLFLYRKLTEGRLDGCGGLSKNYVRTMSIIINSALDYGVKEGLCQPIKGRVYKPKTEKKRITVLKPWEQECLERRIAGDLSHGNLAIYLSLHAGLRIGEVCALRWENIDFQERLLHVAGSVVRLNEPEGTQLRIGTPKTETSNRFIPLTEKVVTVLQQERARNASAFVVTVQNGSGFMNPRTLEYQYKALLHRCGLEPVPFHTLRHTFATRCIECGMDVKSLSEILGHASASVTLDIYVHPSDELKRSGLERTEAVWCQ